MPCPRDASFVLLSIWWAWQHDSAVILWRILHKVELRIKVPCPWHTPFSISPLPGQELADPGKIYPGNMTSAVAACLWATILVRHLGHQPSQVPQ